MHFAATSFSIFSERKENVHKRFPVRSFVGGRRYSMWLHTTNLFSTKKRSAADRSPERSGGLISGSMEIRYITARRRRREFSDVEHSANALQSIIRMF
jgi:hypothetical protein